MSQFEFILVVVSIVAGFAISAILAGWGRFLLAPAQQRPSGLHYLASLFLLFQTVRYVWVLWDFRSIDWPFSSFLLVLLPILTIALAAHVISIPDNRALAGPDLYFSRAGRFFVLEALVIITWSIFDLVHLASIRASAPAGFLPVLFALRGVSAVAFLWLAYSRRTSHHWLVLSVSLTGLAYLSLSILRVLPS